MKILGLDTATLTSGIAILDGDRVLAEARHDASGRTADLLVAIDAAFARAGLEPTAIDAVAIGAGPGSFTGLRIGMATAKGIAFATQRPLWLVSSLAALAEDARATLDNTRRVIAAVLDARRGEVFAGCFRAPALDPLGPERVFAPGELAEWARELAGEDPIVFAGDALAAHREVLEPLAASWLAMTPSGVAIARLAAIGPRTDAVASGAPSYIRPSEAEVKYPDGVPGALRKM
jgi:tRNA threonylcarbamoyladenosine biosynthesis protein TsaB